MASGLLRRIDTLLTVSALLLSQVSAITDQACWYPDGHTLAANDKPCNPGPGPSACCGSNQDGSPAYCLSNGLCLTDLKVTRGSCTDASWNASACASVCRKIQDFEGDIIEDCGYRSGTGGVGLWTCGKCRESNFTMAPSLVVPPAQQAAIIAAAQNTSEPAPTATPSPDVDRPSSTSGPNWTLICGITSGILGLAQLVSLGVIAYQRGRITHFRDRIKAQEKRLDVPWMNRTGGPDGANAAGGGAPRGFGWGAGDGTHENHPWAHYYHQATTEDGGTQHSPHDPLCPGCNLSPSSAEATLVQTVPRGWYPADVKQYGREYHEMEAKGHELLEKELTLAPVEKDCTPPRKRPFERKWFALRRST